MAQDRGDEQHGDHRMDDGPELQRGDVGGKVGEQQEPAGHRHQRAEDNHDPEHPLLAGIEPRRRGMLAVAQQPAAFLDPGPIKPVREIVLDPDQKHHRHAEHEREGEIVMRDLAPRRHRGEGIGAEQRQDQRASETDVEPGERENDEAGRGQPMDEALVAGKAQQF